MKNHGNFPKYRFEPPVPRPAPEHETPEERLKRHLAAPDREIRDNGAFLAALRATIKAERLRSACEEGQRLLDEEAK